MTIYKNLKEFLYNHNANATANAGADTAVTAKKQHTHTRIGDKPSKIAGGSFYIPNEITDEFWLHYYNHVFVNKEKEYLTERQLETDCPILVDFDFRYNFEVQTRQHTTEHILDVIFDVYVELLKEIFKFDETTSFPIYVFEKPTVNTTNPNKEYTKDGIHMIIGLKMDHTMQLYLRKKAIEKIQEVWTSLPLINSWETVFDEGISKGTTNWQIFGSRKPNNQAYRLTYYFMVVFDKETKNVNVEHRKLSEIDLTNPSTLYKLSARYPYHQQFEINPEMKEMIDSYFKEIAKPNKKQRNLKIVNSIKMENNNETKEENNCLNDINNIHNLESLTAAIENVFSGLKLNEYYVEELHKYTQILPPMFYEPGSHLLNRQVGFALKHTDERLFLSWVMLRSKASDFDYGDIPKLFEQWTKWDNHRNDGVTKKSIMYWAKQYSFAEYEKIKRGTVDYYIEQTIYTATDYDFGMVLYQIFKDKYVCSSIAGKTWYVFRNHHWEKDMGHSIRLAISREMYDFYQVKRDYYINESAKYDEEDDAYKKLIEKATKIFEVSIKLKKTNDKNNIFREATEIFYDEEFNKKMNANKYLLCFTNGIVDLKEQIFRDGYPQDYITNSTNIPYIPYNSSLHSSKYEEIMTFMDQLFPIKSLNTYVWQHLASTLFGENINQTFNIYKGSGSNGKSKLTDLMFLTLGDYAETVPITLLTEKRPSIGGTSSEIMKLKNARYVVTQEPSKHAVLNEGVMKQLTGDSTLSGRSLYNDIEKFSVQFDLAVCTNIDFTIESNDDGTWRRICYIDFMSKFFSPGEVVDSDVKYAFPKDLRLAEKLETWAPHFASMLVKLAFETQGIVTICDEVKAASNKFRQCQDHIAGFVNEMIRVQPGSYVKKQELSEQFKLWFMTNQGGRKAPKGVELYEYVTKKYGKLKNHRWNNIELIYQTEENENGENNA
jgi:P4 family phage/plasmid primase-like protien